ncbi:uncharacterized protein LOC112576252 [Pomacea canaliculata]|uniref:uncharacterized protein LOC112576252 n=1 Tax=Pomacea canaliculata TaxID=400727 RepID=UPI000D73FC00|nr:uncharacterized protein LOC112576252 [Pomacea canaliculata]
MQISLFLVLISSILFMSTTATRRIKGGKKCRSSITERKFRKDLLVTCPRDSLLTSANIVGVNGGCEGISPELYVQELLCHWKPSCQIVNNKKPTYLLMPKGGSPSNLPTSQECLAKTAKSFKLNFECTKGTHVMNMPHRTQTRETTARKGLIRSHEEHPWLYSRADHTLTLLNPDPARSMNLQYTFRSFHLWDKDYLTVTWIDQDTGAISTEIFRSNFTLSKDHVSKLATNAERVTFALQTITSNGGSGFVICFAWSHPDENPKNSGACEGLFHKANCSFISKTRRQRRQKLKQS